MKSAPTLGFLSPAFKSLGIAAALVCSTGGALAADATVSITSFTASTDPFSGNYVWATDAYQSFSMTALNGGGLYGSASDAYEANDWNQGANRLAQTSRAMASGNTVQFTDAFTQLATGGFNLAAMAWAGGSPVGTPANYANATALQAGAFTLIDGDGQAIGGSITFDIYYDLNVVTPLGGSPLTYAQTVLSLLASSDAGGSASFDDGLLSSNLTGGVGTVSGHFTWTFDLAAGEAAYYTLGSSAIAVAAVPEAGGFMMMGFGLLATGAFMRRRRSGERAR